MTLRSFTQAPARILPVIVLADTSGSMHGEKIAELNHALREMIANLGLVHEQRAQIYVAIVRFGGDTADVVMPLTPAAQCTPPEFAAEGRTPLGAALELVNALLVDEEQVPVSAYAPAIILVSDGLPTDTGFKEACTSTPRLKSLAWMSP